MDRNRDKPRSPSVPWEAVVRDAIFAGAKATITNSWPISEPLEILSMNSNPLTSNPSPVALVTGGSAGLGVTIATALAQHGYHVVIIGRNASRLKAAASSISDESKHPIDHHVADATSASDMERVITQILSDHGRLDAIINCVGQSDRGTIEHLTVDRLRELIDQNIIATLVSSQAALPALEESHGSIVNIGSLASKVSPRYLGGYAIAKHGLAALTGQMRLELQPRGIHVALLSPGPIARTDAGTRYDDRLTAEMPEEAKRPGGGTRVKGLDPQRVAIAVVQCLEKRKPDVLLPRYLRILIAVGHAFPRLGDWLLLKFSS